MSRLWLTSLLIVAMVTQSLTQTVSSPDSTCGCTDSNGKLSCSRPDSHPVNIQIGGDCTSAIDELLNVTRTMLNLLQTLAPSSTPAPDVDECTAGTTSCDFTNGGCSNTIGSFICTCNSGYELNVDGFTCDDVDECLAGTTSCDFTNGGCSNTIGSFMCTCNSRYELNVDGFTCDVSARDCSEIQAGGVNISGVYRIYPDGASNALDVYCDMETDGGGWTVFQRRQDGSVNFYRGWDDYKNGFGSDSTEHWLGNDNIHFLSTQKTCELRVDLEDFEGETRYASYIYFNIADEAAKYRLTIGVYSGDAGDSLIYHVGRSFTTKDRDNDDWGSANCAVIRTGAWWYRSCHHSNLNAQYLNGINNEEGKSVTWFDWHGYSYSLKKTEMKIRPA